ncbi:prolyl oligopeptidase family serine peptidase [Rufibacter glacialis]|uniref:Prolyl oligopeptidase family serine peptidase n=1 Tax=Rufibacter glacialis TaxID=1259555 RepID=A0A5M8Q4F8_9BACT|nr:S9 family peptidase [Rufibacter glacialis]KAA6430765.1 S9 family peptidase [Rufibacter glacialis]GGK86532.1 peptidase S9 [Rufibacter glacialis]
MNKQLPAVLLLWLASFSWAWAQQPQNLVQVTDLLKIKQVGTVALAPDGRQVVYTVTAIEPDPEKKNDYRYTTQLHLQPSSGNEPARQLTYGSNASQPAWSPDAKQLAFVRVVDGKPQIFLLSFAGGEPVQLTRFKYGASQPVWSPNGQQLLFTSGIALNELLSDSTLNPGRELPKWSYEKPGFFQNENLRTNPAKPNPDGTLAEIRGYLDQNEKDNKAKVINQLRFQEESTTSSNLNLSHIFLIDAKPGATPKDLTAGFVSSSNASFLPNGRQIIFDADADAAENPTRSQESAIYLVNTDGTGLKQLLGKKGMSYSGSTVSPSGKWLAFQYSPSNRVAIPALGLVPVNGSPTEMVTIAHDRNKGNLTWSDNDKYLYFNSPSNGGILLNRADVQKRKVEPLTEVTKGIGAFDLKKNQLVYALTEVANPNELYAATAEAKKPVRLTSLNHDWVSQKKLSQPVKHTFTNTKGQTVEYWVMKPTNYVEGQKYPLLLEIHGGPTAMWGPGESSMWHEYQYFASRGYGVVYANPRGSGGYGEEFMRANIKDWGAGPASDVLTALDQTVAQGWADTARLAITGGSYGGYLVSWILGHDKRFKAACSQRGVYDLSTFFGEGNAWRLVPNYFGGYPWEEAHKGLIQSESPLTYVQHITTPLIIFHGENDLRTGVIQSEMLYKSLKVLNRPVEYVRHPGATHEITRTGNNRQRIDQMLRTYEFFERYLQQNKEIR